MQKKIKEKKVKIASQIKKKVKGLSKILRINNLKLNLARIIIVNLKNFVQKD
jgi:hypothetical protein